MKINTIFKKKNAAQHQLVSDRSREITKPRDLSSAGDIASTSDKVDGALRLADVTTPEPDLARKSFTF